MVTTEALAGGTVALAAGWVPSAALGCRCNWCSEPTRSLPPYSWAVGTPWWGKRSSIKNIAFSLIVF